VDLGPFLHFALEHTKLVPEFFAAFFPGETCSSWSVTVAASRRFVRSFQPQKMLQYFDRRPTAIFGRILLHFGGAQKIVRKYPENSSSSSRHTKWPFHEKKIERRAGAIFLQL
jgi:hypothetical protein